MKLKLPDNITSQQDVMELLAELHDYSKSLSHQDILKRTNSKSTSQLTETSKEAKELMRIWTNGKTIDSSSLNELIKSVTDYKDNAPKMTITLAAPATNDIKKTLTVWCRDNISSNLLIDFQFNRIILGGMVLRFGSHIYDWSFRRQILDGRDKFPEILRHV